MERETAIVLDRVARLVCAKALLGMPIMAEITVRDEPGLETSTAPYMAHAVLARWPIPDELEELERRIAFYWREIVFRGGMG